MKFNSTDNENPERTTLGWLPCYPTNEPVTVNKREQSERVSSASSFDPKLPKTHLLHSLHANMQVPGISK
uniref:Uncharacterized protein n=1 Tax=Anopheles aquasalis TaxID=42839 RepID=T1E942_ANOAQ